jgi:uncharacterized protein YdiU (UPF0061 family)
MMQNKLGLFSLKEDRQLIQMLTETATETDMTIFFRKLSEIKNNKPLKMLLN